MARSLRTRAVRADDPEFAVVRAAWHAVVAAADALLGDVAASERATEHTGPRRERPWTYGPDERFFAAQRRMERAVRAASKRLDRAARTQGVCRA